jgi:hypothetical protein
MFRYSTNYVIEDPEDSDGCHALESENIQTDKSFIGCEKITSNEKNFVNLKYKNSIL